MTKDAEIKERIQQIVESLDSEQLTQLWDYLEALVGGERAGFAEARPVYAVMQRAEKKTRQVIDQTKNPPRRNGVRDEFQGENPRCHPR